MQTKTLTTQVNQNLTRTVVGVLFFTALMALTARITIPIGPVPITLQLLAVVLSGLVLGAWGGFAAQVAYLGLIATGLPVDTNAVGAAAFIGPTAGYLIGFAPAAFVTGWLAQRFSAQSWWGNFVAAIAGIVVIYAAGASWLAYLSGWAVAWTFGVKPFILIDLGKAIVAASVAESGKYWLNR